MRGQRTTVRPVHHPLSIEHLQVLANGDLGCRDMTRKIADDHETIPLQQVEYCPAALFVQHLLTRDRKGNSFEYCFFLYRFVSSVQRKAAPQRSLGPTSPLELPGPCPQPAGR